jgi:SH3-like domain-containing protein
MKLLTLLYIFVFLGIYTGYANALCVKASKANLRTGPDTAYAVAWEVYKNMPFEKVGVSLSGEWLAVRDIDGDVTWIYKGLVTEKIKCAAVKADNVNVRSGAGTKYGKSPIGPAKKYYSYTVVDRRGDWVKVKDEWGGTGWIHNSYLWIQ